jgi:hypothetical protein
MRPLCPNGDPSPRVEPRGFGVRHGLASVAPAVLPGCVEVIVTLGGDALPPPILHPGICPASPRGHPHRYPGGSRCLCPCRGPWANRAAALRVRPGPEDRFDPALCAVLAVSMLLACSVELAAFFLSLTLVATRMLRRERRRGSGR